MNFPSGFYVLLMTIIILILVSIQCTLNLILKEIKEIRKRIGCVIQEESERRGGCE